MILENERLIIVCGMAHSGTTILTYILQQHPNIYCYTDGTEAWILENTWIPSEESEPIQKIINTTPKNNRILLKRPWSTVHHSKWLLEEMPNAYFIYCYRSFEDIVISWEKPNSFIDENLRNSSKEFKNKIYDSYFEATMKFASNTNHFLVSDHDIFLSNPQDHINNITNWLKLPPHNYETSQVCENPLYNIKNFLWLKQNLKT